MRKIGGFIGWRTAIGMSVAVALSGMSVLALHAATDSNPQSQVRFGIYDPLEAFPDAPAVDLQHIYQAWDEIDRSGLREVANTARQRNRDLLITLEPWTWLSDDKQPSDQLLADILAGRYASNIEAFCGTVGSLDVPVTIRWAHEMEDPKTPYTWSKWSPSDYIKAYRTFVDECRRHAPNAQYMWSPKGDPEAPSFYPGARYVDSIGVSVFGYQRYDQEVLGRERTVEELIRERYQRFTDLGKPIYVAEFGCAGLPEYQRSCIQQLPYVGDALPQLKAVVYFNAAEHTPWPDPFGLPDWRLPESAFGATQ